MTQFIGDMTMSKIDSNLETNPFSFPKKQPQHSHSVISAPKDIKTPINDHVSLNNNNLIGMKSVFQSISLKFSSTTSLFDKALDKPEESKAALFDFEKVAETVMAFVSSTLSAAKERGATDNEINEMFDQARSGVNQGIDDAIGELKELSIMDDALNDGIEQSRTLISESIDRLYQQFFPLHENADIPNVSASNKLNAQSRQVDFNSELYASTSSKSDLSITTADGDVVNISFSDIQEYARSQQYNFRSNNESDEKENKGSNIESNQFTQSSYREVNFSYTVEGELDEQERDAISSLIKDVNKLQKDFFHGDIEKAYEKALLLGFDDKELSGFSLDLQQTQTSYVSQKYAEVATLGDPKAAKINKDIKPLIDFVDQFKQLRATANDILAQDKDQFSQLLDAIFEAEFGPDEHALNQFKHFIDKFEE